MVKAGYKQTEIGVIPDDWEVEELRDFIEINSGDSPSKFTISNDGIPYFKVEQLNNTKKYLTNETPYFIQSSKIISAGSVLFPKRGAAIFLNKIRLLRNDSFFDTNLMSLTPSSKLSSEYLFYILSYKGLEKVADTTSVPQINNKHINPFKIPIPPKEEQIAIANALSDVDELITSLEKLIAKKESIKTATMQQLLTGKKRLNGFSGKWEIYTIENIGINLDNLRIPLNENQRSKMKGDIPYCGANGIVGYVNDFVIDDDILLMAEDGGYFDEYATRPIVYRMVGKCWVNNHAHILKSKDGFNQDYLYYSLVHKDITKYLASGTRAKLNKSEMYKIEVYAPQDINEQQAIAKILTDMDNEIEALKTKLSKTKAMKDGMMSELLSGKTRLKV